MAYPDDTQTPPTPEAPVPPPQPAQQANPDYVNGWRSWMQNPENRASLMQFGISMLQPIGVGQSAAGHFGQAVGQAGEAATRVRAEDMARQKQAAETDLAAQRAGLAEKSAGLAEQRAGVASQQVGMQTEALELKRMLGSSQRAAELQKRFQEAKLLDPTLKLEDFVAQNRQFIKLIQQEEGGPQGGAPGAIPVMPKVGEVIRGFRYKGGDPKDKNSWERQ